MTQLTEVLGALRCPVCAGPFEATDDGKSLRCHHAHLFDIARQGYVTLLSGRSLSHNADTVDMVAARDRVHAAGFLDPVVDAVTDAAREAAPAARFVADLGSGPGHYLRAVLRAVPTARGLGLDVSKSSARAAVRGRPSAAAVVADVWSALPLGTGVADVALSIFAPRNPDEMARILRPGGTLVMVTPQPDHLGEIIEPMGMLSVAADKDDRIAAAMTPAFETISIRDVSWVRDAGAELVADLAGMGPSAFHSEADRLRETADRLVGAGDGRVAVTGAVRVTCLRPRSGPDRRTDGSQISGAQADTAR